MIAANVPLLAQNFTAPVPKPPSGVPVVPSTGDVVVVLFIVDASAVETGLSIVALDNVGGDTIGTMYVPDTGGDEKWVTVKCPIKKITGTHNVILKFYGKSPGNLFNIDSITFNKSDILERTGWMTKASISSQDSNAAIDGNTGSNWYTENPNSWWSVDMKDVKTFDKISLYTNNSSV